MIVNTRKQSYFILDELLPTVEVGSMIFDPTTNKFFMVLKSGEVEEINPEEALKNFMDAIAAGGEVEVSNSVDAPTGFVISADTVITNNSEISIFEDTAGDGVFKVIDGTLTLDGKGTINGLGKNDYCMAIWATENGKVIINDGYFTNVGAHSEEDGEHFDLIYASGNGQVEINGGEFKCETPKWTVNIKDNSRKTAKITIKGGKFHGFNPADCLTEGEGTNFVAEGYKVVEETENVFVVIPE
jgi:hypothetical protein